MTEAQKCLYHIAENMRMDKSISKEGYEYFQQAIKALEQEPRKGHWIDTKENSTNTRGQIIHEVICSECNGIAYFRSIGNKYIGANICPNCGADMQEVEE